MKTTILIILIVFSASYIFAQMDCLSYQKGIEALNIKVVTLQNNIEELQNFIHANEYSRNIAHISMASFHLPVLNEIKEIYLKI